MKISTGAWKQRPAAFKTPTLITTNSCRELGYWIGRKFWNRGYCTEAARAVVDFGFSVLGLHRIQGRHLTRNPASGRVMAKLDMQSDPLTSLGRDSFCFEAQAFPRCRKARRLAKLWGGGLVLRAFAQKIASQGFAIESQARQLCNSLCLYHNQASEVTKWNP